MKEAPEGLGEVLEGQSRAKSQHLSTRLAAEAGEDAPEDPLETTEGRVGG